MSFQPNVSRYHTETAVLLGTGPKQSSAGHFTAAATALYRVNAPQEQLRSAISLSVILCITQCINETADGQTYCQLHFYSYTVHSDITVSHCQLLNAPQKQLTVRHQCQLLHIQTSVSVTVHSDIIVSYCTFRHHCQLLYIQTLLSVTAHHCLHKPVWPGSKVLGW